MGLIEWSYFVPVSLETVRVPFGTGGQGSVVERLVTIKIASDGLVIRSDWMGYLIWLAHLPLVP